MFHLIVSILTVLAFMFHIYNIQEVGVPKHWVVILKSGMIYIKKKITQLNTFKAKLQEGNKPCRIVLFYFVFHC